MASASQSRLTARELRAISGHAVTRTCAIGTVVVSEGDVTNSLFVVVAGRIGASREMVSRILKELVAGGYIHIEQKRMVIAKTLPRKW